MKRMSYSKSAYVQPGKRYKISGKMQHCKFSAVKFWVGEKFGKVSIKRNVLYAKMLNSFSCYRNIAMQDVAGYFFQWARVTVPLTNLLSNFSYGNFADNTGTG